jgi:hypothetical protein
MLPAGVISSCTVDKLTVHYDKQRHVLFTDDGLVSLGQVMRNILNISKDVIYSLEAIAQYDRKINKGTIEYPGYDFKVDFTDSVDPDYVKTTLVSCNDILDWLVRKLPTLEYTNPTYLTEVFKLIDTYDWTAFQLYMQTVSKQSLVHRIDVIEQEMNKLATVRSALKAKDCISEFVRPAPSTLTSIKSFVHDMCSIYTQQQELAIKKSKLNTY